MGEAKLYKYLIFDVELMMLHYGNVMIGCSEVEVQYKDIVEEPDYFRDANETELVNAFKFLGYGKE